MYLFKVWFYQGESFPHIGQGTPKEHPCLDVEDWIVALPNGSVQKRKHTLHKTLKTYL